MKKDNAQVQIDGDIFIDKEISMDKAPKTPKISAIQLFIITVLIIMTVTGFVGDMIQGIFFGTQVQATVTSIKLLEHTYENREKEQAYETTVEWEVDGKICEHTVYYESRPYIGELVYVNVYKSDPSRVLEETYRIDFFKVLTIILIVLFVLQKVANHQIKNNNIPDKR